MSLFSGKHDQRERGSSSGIAALGEAAWRKPFAPLVAAFVIPSAISLLCTGLAESARIGHIASHEPFEGALEQPAQSTFLAWGLLWALLLSLFLIGLSYILMNRMRVQGRSDILSASKSRAKRYSGQGVHTNFADVAGASGAKRELQETVGYLRHPGKYHHLGAEVPRGVLLVGPPGTGKTLLARAVAGEAGVPFFSISGSDFIEVYVGIGAARVRDMFAEAKKVAPGIIFIDEINSLGRRRGSGLGGAHEEREQTLNQLLSEMDGFEKGHSVIVIAATNRPDILDPALLRPGRFDRQITVGLPTTLDRLEILRVHARHKPLAEDVSLEQIARGTPGFSGADLENLLNEAALLAARQNKEVIEQADVEEARDKVTLGLERENLQLTDEERRMLAYHEGGHAIVAAVLPHADPIHKVSIVPRGRAMGVTQQVPEREKFVYPREYMLDRLAVMMGGRAAEELVFNTATSGAENDLQQATQLARRMVLKWGMGERLQHMALGDDSGEGFLGEEIGLRREYSDATAHEIEMEIMAILDGAFDRATCTLREYRDQLDRLAGMLLVREELAGSDVLELVGRPACCVSDDAVLCRA